MPLAFGLLIWAVVVIASMIVVGFLATRWGREPFGWLLLAAAMGPFAVVGLLGTRQTDLERRGRPPVRPGSGSGALLAACDGSAATERIARYLAVMHPPGSNVVLLVVLPHEARSPDHAPSDEHDHRVRAATARAKEILEQAGVRARVDVAYGNPAEEILRYAADSQAAVIVIGRRGAGLAKTLLGSVSDAVVREARQPVVVLE